MLVVDSTIFPGCFVQTGETPFIWWVYACAKEASAVKPWKPGNALPHYLQKDPLQECRASQGPLHHIDPVGVSDRLGWYQRLGHVIRWYQRIRELLRL